MAKRKSKRPDAEGMLPCENVTPPCQGKVSGRWCYWFPTRLYRKRWLCDQCAEVYLNRLMVRRIKDKLRKQRKRVT